MKRNGFTLVELLAVIVILALLLSIAVPGVITMANRIQGNMFCSKVEDIERAAQMWGEDNYDAINLTSGKSQTISLATLIQKNYLKKDDTKTTDSSKFITDPRDSSSLLEKNVKVFIKNSRVYASYQYDSEIDEELCK